MKKMMFRLISIFSCVLLTFFAHFYSYAATGFDVEQIYESVFVIYTDSSVGSGFAIGENAIITNAHVVEEPGDIIVVAYDGNTYSAEIALYDEELDLALLVTEYDGMRPLKIGSIDAVKVGDDIYTIGAPNSMAYTLTKGVISAKERWINHQSYIQIDAAINGGNSGGPLLNDYGEVIGVNTLKISDTEGIGLSIPIERVKDFLIDGGVSLGSNSNIEQKLDYVETITEMETDDENVNSDVGAENRKMNLKKTNSILVIALVVSGSLNIILGILYFILKKKSKVQSIDKSERMDFEIEIEE